MSLCQHIRHALATVESVIYYSMAVLVENVWNDLVNCCTSFSLCNFFSFYLLRGAKSYLYTILKRITALLTFSGRKSEGIFGGDHILTFSFKRKYLFFLTPFLTKSIKKNSNLTNQNFGKSIHGAWSHFFFFLGRLRCLYFLN